MPATKPVRPQQRARLQTGTLISADPSVVSRHVSDLATQVNRVTSQAADRNVQTVNLIVGDNVINHGLGRPARGCTVTPTVADATFAWCLKSSDAKQATITVVGVNQTGATLEVF